MIKNGQIITNIEDINVNNNMKKPIFYVFKY